MQVTALANGMFDVTSERDETVSYIVDPKTVSCSCPDFRSRRCQKGLGDPQRRCKHMRTAEIQPAPEPFGEVTPFVPLTDEQRAEEAEMVKLFGPTQWQIMVECWTEAERGQAIRQARAAAKQPTKLEKAAETARQLSDLELSRLAKKHLGGVPGAACLLEMARRVNALQERDPMQADALRSGRIIDAAEWLRQDAIEAGYAAAPRPIPAGVLELLQGATEAERERALSIYS